MSNKIFGFILLFLGLVIIGGTLYHSYNIFTGKITMPEIFKTPQIEQTTPSKNKTTDLQKQLEEQMAQTVQKQISQILPQGSVPKLLNLISWSVLAGILLLGGSQIAGLGIKLLK